MTTSETTIDTSALPDYAPVPRSAIGPALNEQGYYVARVERNLYWVTDGTYQCAFLTTSDGVVVLDTPPTIGNNIQRAIDEIAAANGVSNKVNYLVYSHHHADHVGASSLFDKNITRIGHEETRRLLLRDDDPARPPNEETFQDRRTLEIGGERIDLAWHGPNHSPDNIVIHLPDHETLMLVDIVNPGWAPVYLSNLTEDIPGYLEPRRVRKLDLPANGPDRDRGPNSRTLRGAALPRRRAARTEGSLGGAAVERPRGSGEAPCACRLSRLRRGRAPVGSERAGAPARAESARPPPRPSGLAVREERKPAAARGRQAPSVSLSA
jgi:glyoxylase-like metal-dependent hydrolase (beta-lactamase superfamily II)